MEPQFPFGFGLSYTTFEYSDLSVIPFVTHSGTVKLEGTLVTVKVKNSGSRAGAEVVQLYVHDDHAKIDRPAHELKAFKRVELKPGESQTVKFSLDKSAYEYWSPDTKQWTLAPGTFEIQVGASSRDIRLKAPLQVMR